MRSRHGLPGCGGSREVGALCRACAAALSAVRGAAARPRPVQRRRTAAWLIDGFGRWHAVSDRGPWSGAANEGDLVILNGSVSRRTPSCGRADDGWQMRDSSAAATAPTSTAGGSRAGRRCARRRHAVRRCQLPVRHPGAPPRSTTSRALATIRTPRSAPFASRCAARRSIWPAGGGRRGRRAGGGALLYRADTAPPGRSSACRRWSTSSCARCACTRSTRRPRRRSARLRPDQATG